MTYDIDDNDTKASFTFTAEVTITLDADDYDSALSEVRDILDDIASDYAITGSGS